MNPHCTTSSAEGIHALHDPELRKLYDLKVILGKVNSGRALTSRKVFVQADSDLMLARRIARDTKERGRSVDGILEQYVLLNCLGKLAYNLARYLRYVKPSFDNFVLPSSRHADIVRLYLRRHTTN
jgi:uridine kinase